MSFLEKLKSANRRPFFTKPNFNILFDLCKEAIASLPPSSCTWSNQQSFESEQFETYVYMSFLDAFMKEVEAAFSKLDFWMVFNLLDPRALPEELDLLDEYGVDELGKLLSHYGDDKFDIYNGDESHQKADLITVVVQAEWNSFIRMVLQCRKLYQCSTDPKLTKENDKEKVEKLMKEQKNYALSKFFNNISHDETCCNLYPSCMHLLKLSLMFPLSVACVKHLFSKMKLIKTRLRNQLGETTLDSLL